jgi:hypothetical protein
MWSCASLSSSAPRWGTGGSNGNAIVPDSSGALVYALIGAYKESGGSYVDRSIVVAYGARSGQVAWTREIDDSSYGLMALSPDGTCLVLAGGTSTGVATTCLDPSDGATRWTLIEPSVGVRVDSLTSVAGRDVVIEARTASSASGSESSAVAIGLDGGLRWSTPVGFSSRGAQDVVTAAPDGSAIFLATADDTAGTGMDYLTSGLDPVTGVVRWTARYSGARSLDQVTAIAVDPQTRRVFVTGLASGNYGTVAYRATNGRELWVATYDNGQTDRAFAVGVSSRGGRVFVTGQSVASWQPRSLCYGRLRRRNGCPGMGRT